VFYARTEGVTNYILLYTQVLEYEIGTILRVCHNAANMRSGEYDCNRTLLVEKLCHGYGVEKVELGMCAPYDIGIPTPLQVCHNGRPDQAAMTGNVDFIVFIYHCL